MALDAAAHGQVERAERWLSRAEELGIRRQSEREAALNALARARVALKRGQRAAWRSAADIALRGFERLAMQTHANYATVLMDDPMP